MSLSAANRYLKLSVVILMTSGLSVAARKPSDLQPAFHGDDRELNARVLNANPNQMLADSFSES